MTIKKEEAKQLIQKFQKEISAKQYDLILYTLRQEGKEHLWQALRDDILIPAGINLLDKLKTVPVGFFQSSDILTDITIPNNIIEIEQNAFRDCSKLKSVNFAENSNVGTIAENAFTGCAALNKISLPSSIAYIGKRVFEECENLKGIEFPANLDHEVIIDYHAFGSSLGQKVDQVVLDEFIDKVIEKLSSKGLDEVTLQKRKNSMNNLKKSGVSYIKPKIYIGKGGSYAPGYPIKTAGGGVIVLTKVDGRSEGAQYQGLYPWLDVTLDTM